MSGVVRQSAGDVKIEVYTGGSPLWPEITMVANNGEKHTTRVSVSHLHDLRYCIDRVLAQLGDRS